MRAITAEKLKDILAKHKKWLNGEEGGEQADLRGTDLRYVDLKGANLRFVRLQGVALQFADLRDTDLRFANLRDADLKCANLKGADLRGANFLKVNLLYADLRFADLRDANVYGADLKGAYRPWLVYAGNIGSRRYETLYFADCDSVRCGCWNDYLGGMLAEFKARIDEVYPADSKNEEYQRYRLEYLSAIKMFSSMREAYLKSVEEEKEHD